MHRELLEAPGGPRSQQLKLCGRNSTCQNLNGIQGESLQASWTHPLLAAAEAARPKFWMSKTFRSDQTLRAVHAPLIMSKTWLAKKQKFAAQPRPWPQLCWQRARPGSYQERLPAKAPGGCAASAQPRSRNSRGSLRCPAWATYMPAQKQKAPAATMATETDDQESCGSAAGASAKDEAKRCVPET